MTTRTSPANSPLINKEDTTPPNTPLFKDDYTKSLSAREILSANKKRSLDESDQVSPPTKKPTVLAPQGHADKWSSHCKSVSGYSSYHSRLAIQLPMKKVVGSLYAVGQEEAQPTFPSCSMPSASTSGYSSYNNRLANELPLKEVMGSLYPVEQDATHPTFPTCSMPSASTSGYSSYHNRSAKQGPSKEVVGSLYAVGQNATQPTFPTCSMPSASTSGYASYQDRSVAESGFVNQFDFFF